MLLNQLQHIVFNCLECRHTGMSYLASLGLWDVNSAFILNALSRFHFASQYQSQLSSSQSPFK